MNQEELNKILNEHKQWLYGTCGKRADLQGAYLRGADLQGADLRGAYLRGADLRGAYLRGADLRGADLRGAYLRGADLQGAYLQGADLQGADLQGADGIGLNCPETGSFIGFKKAYTNQKRVIVKLQITEDAKRSSATSRKCRCSKAVVLEISDIAGVETDIQEAHSGHDTNFIYRVGETVTVDNFDEDRWNECSTGIHFFITRKEAVDY
jgi:uncharacterized protein YjbI with pentapeptide repeats